MARKKVKVGDLYEVNTFAGVVVHVRITQVLDDVSYSCVLVRESDLKALREANVYVKKGEKPEDVEHPKTCMFLNNCYPGHSTISMK